SRRGLDQSDGFMTSSGAGAPLPSAVAAPAPALPRLVGRFWAAGGFGGSGAMGATIIGAGTTGAGGGGGAAKRPATIGETRGQALTPRKPTAPRIATITRPFA